MDFPCTAWFADLAQGLDKQTLSICVGMIEAGANPDTLAVSPQGGMSESGMLITSQAVVKELRREGESLKPAQR